MEQRHLVRIGLYGNNGHQLPVTGVEPWRAKGNVIATAGFAATDEAGRRSESSPRRYESLEELLDDPDVELVSLCSPRRADQAADAITCMRAGRHVLAEKPCAMSETDLDRIIETARASGCVFHEMSPTLVEEPYTTMRRVVQDGSIGAVIQVFGQKSYPWFNSRPEQEEIDGGLTRQVGIYLYRFVEHVAGEHVSSSIAFESLLGNHGPGSACRRAVSINMQLENGGVASGVANYSTPAPPVWRPWGYETLRIFGEQGFLESINAGETLRLVTTVGGAVILTPDATEQPSFTEWVLRDIRGQATPLLSLEQELRPTRMVNRAKAAAVFA